jgi:hypothetical protein
MNLRICLALLLLSGACMSPLEETAQEAQGGGGGVADVYLGFLDELSRPESSIDANIRAGMPDARIFWATGSPVPSSIAITSELPGTVAVGIGGYTYSLGERRRGKPTGYRLPLTFDVPRTAIGTTITVTGRTQNSRGTSTLTQELLVVDAPTTPTGVTVTKVGTELVVSWLPSQYGIGPIHYVVENLSCATPRVCEGVTVADTSDTTVRFIRTNSLLRIRAVADNADSNLFEQDISTF